MYGTEPVTSSPNLTLVHRVHARSQPALKVPGKVPRVGERPADSEQPGRVGARLDALLEGLVPVLGAPNVGSAQPKQLIGGVVEAGKALLLSVPLDPALCKIETENLRVHGATNFTLLSDKSRLLQYQNSKENQEWMTHGMLRKPL